ncbi:hypothetical protein ZHAS_00020279 [Anopheles sinensis]|uniref:Uncharacterized protein n=1 Tax=Anopheles sinensis TaxID=74873 RepID=A0A084WPN0_ANOSI|nr:hypothetical protein ZHAS_00020279 [Anopheles sinensis]
MACWSAGCCCCWLQRSRLGSARLVSMQARSGGGGFSPPLPPSSRTCSGSGRNVCAWNGSP